MLKSTGLAVQGHPR